MHRETPGSGSGGDRILPTSVVTPPSEYSNFLSGSLQSMHSIHNKSFCAKDLRYFTFFQVSIFYYRDVLRHLFYDRSRGEVHSYAE